MDSSFVPFQNETDKIKLAPDLQRFLLRLFAAVSVLLVLTLISAYWMGRKYYLNAQAVDLNKLVNYSETSLFYDRDGKEISRVFTEDRTVLKRDDIPLLMRQAIIAVEDRRFYKHMGIDPKAIARAVWVNLLSERLEGGSTLTQQLAKYLLADFSKTIDRKFQEAFVALRIEKEYSKEEILDMYLNRVYFGYGYFGLEAAARGYFGKRAKELSIGECALLAGIIRSPNSSSPRNSLERAVRQRNLALEQMVDEKFITQSQADKAKKENINLVSKQRAGVKSYAMACAMKELYEVLNLQEDEIPHGMKVRTTIDLGIQAKLEAQLHTEIVRLEKELINAQTTNKLANDHDPLQGAALIADVTSGAVRALVGGRDFAAYPFDRVTMARRENGAILQPLIYAWATERIGFSPASLINTSFIPDDALAKPETLVMGDPNQDVRARFLTVHDALALGSRPGAIRTGVAIGLQSVRAFFQSAGVWSQDINPMDLLSGVSRLTLWEITSLYQALGNQGQYHRMHIIESVRNSDGKKIYIANEPKQNVLLEPLTAQQMTLTLQSAGREGNGRNIDLQFELPEPIAGMTGYSIGYRDAWYAGYTPSTVIGVWMGYDKSRALGDKTSVIRTAAPIAGSILKKILPEDSDPKGFEASSSLIKVGVDRFTGAVQGLGGLNPGINTVLVYLKQNQLEDAKKKIIRNVTNKSVVEDWANWLTTIFSGSLDATDTRAIPAVLQVDTYGIPPFAEYVMPPLRGDILTADGMPLAATLNTNALVLAWPTAETVVDEDEAVALVQRKIAMVTNSLPITFWWSEEDLRRMYRYQRFNPILLNLALDEKGLKWLQEQGLDKEGFAPQPYPVRLYPMGKALAHTIGTLQRNQKRNFGELQAGDVIYEDYSGVSGLEAAFDKEIKGKRGRFVIKTNPFGFAQTAGVEEPATKGANVITTIDSRLQKAVEQAMDKVNVGAAVILNPTNGDIVAMASRPDFDPNAFLPALPAEQWKAILESPTQPLLNRPFQQHNPPGSVFKVITAMAAARSGNLDTNRIYKATGGLQVGNIHYRFPKELRSLAFADAVAFSYNSYFIDLGLRTGRDALLDTARQFGFGTKTGFILPGELPGLVPDPDFVRRTHQRTMGAGDVANTSIGQGDLLVTPLQMAVAFAAVANNGAVFQPRLVSALLDNMGNVKQTFESKILNQVDASPEMFAPVQNAMVGVTDYGTARKAQVKGILVAAKTGTAQVGSKAKPRQIAWLAGFLPADNPQYAFSVMVEGSFEEEIAGGGQAAPIVGEIFSSIFNPPVDTAAVRLAH